MERVKIITHCGKPIVYIDFSDCPKPEVPTVIAAAEQLISTLPLNSALTLTNVTNLIFNQDIIEAFKGFTIHNKPYVKASAVLGIKGLQRIAHQVITHFSNRTLPVFDDQQTALDWLTNVDVAAQAP